MGRRLRGRNRTSVNLKLVSSHRWVVFLGETYALVKKLFGTFWHFGWLCCFIELRSVFVAGLENDYRKASV